MNRRIEFIESYRKIGNDYQWSDNHGELVRCKDCKHGVQRYIAEDGSHVTISDGWIQCRRYDRYKNHKEDWYCADGERIDE